MDDAFKKYYETLAKFIPSEPDKDPVTLDAIRTCKLFKMVLETLN